ncbi:MAG TPA: hypothetical protein H9829_04520 [Candidatus Tetragenococcus pullicola]|nr:hypothetical protein [Candidatus Tetragenococcus pullicola]
MNKYSNFLSTAGVSVLVTSSVILGGLLIAELTPFLAALASGPALPLVAVGIVVIMLIVDN